MNSVYSLKAGLLLCVLLNSAVTTAQDLTFENPIIVTANYNARDVFVGNLDGDAILDLITLGYSSDDIKVHIGQGGVSYASPFSYGAADGPQRFTVADFNGDGFPDVAATASLGDVVTVRLNSQFGTFYTSATYSAGNTPLGITSDDFNGDGFLDLAVAIDLDDEKAIYLGNGDGTFQSALLSFGGDRPHGIRAADLNGDGFSDLLVSNRNDDELGVFLGNGDGTFGPLTSYLTGGLITEFLELGDMNGDGLLDAILSNFGTDEISILTGNADGTFNTATTYLVADGPKGLTLVDLNADGFLDVAVACETANIFSVLLGNGDGTLQTAIDFTSGTGTYHVKHADLNEDGYQDLLVVNRLNGGEVYIYLNQFCPGISVEGMNVTTLEGTDGSATVTITGGLAPFEILWDDPMAQTSETAIGLSPGTYTVSVIDANLCEANASIEIMNPICEFGLSIQIDAVPTIGGSEGGLTAVLEGGIGPFIVAWEGIDLGDELSVSGLSYGIYSVVVTDGIGCPALASIQLMEAVDFCDSTSILMRVEEVYFEDLNNDGVDDFIGINPWADNSLEQLGLGDGTFDSPTVYETGAYSQNATFADFNGDGIMDMVVTAPDSPDNGITTLFGNGDGTFQPGVNKFVGSRPWDIRHEDFDNDGDFDLIVTREQGDNVQVFSNNGVGTFISGSSLSTGISPKHLDNADFNEDGFMDFVVSNSGGWDLSIILGDGTLIPDLGTELQTTFHPYDVVAADLNNDAHFDIVTVNDENDRLSVWLGNGDGTFQAEMLFDTPAQPLAITAGDYNDDGYVDLATANRNGLSISVYPGAGNGTFNVVQTFDMPRPLGITTENFDQDGDDDLVVALDSFGAPFRVIFFENCRYGECLGDFNDDGQINTADLITLLSGLGCLIDCPTDINGDGLVNTTDLIAFLGLFGGGC